MKPSQDTTYDEARTSATEVVQWAQALTDLHDRIAPRFARPEPRRRALSYLKGIMSEIERKNGWQLAEHAREVTPYGMQRLLSDAVWDDALVRDDLRNYVYEHLGSLGAILVLDETSILKQGEKSVAVQVQYCGTTGRLENCQVAVFLDYVTPRGHTLVDVRLYIPESWIDSWERRREAGIPDTVRFQTKCELARSMVEQVWKAQIPISWVVADTVYGNDLDLRIWLEAIGYFYVLAVACNEPVGIQTPDGRCRLVEVREVEALLLQAEDWQRLSMGDGTKGPRLFDWTAVPILHRWECDGQHWLLLRRCIDNPKVKTYYFVFGALGTTLQQMVLAIGARWRIEDDIQTSKGLGLDQYEVRCWTPWYRHITLVMLAHAFLAIICADNRDTTVVDPAERSSQVTVVDASPILPVPSVPPTLKSSPPLSTPPAVPLPTAERSSTLSVREATPLPKVSPILSVPEAPAPPIPHIPPPLPTPLAFSSPPHLSPAPLTIPEVCHLLGSLMWPICCSASRVLDWSWWRRRHRGMASYYHSIQRLKAG